MNMSFDDYMEQRDKYGHAPLTITLNLNYVGEHNKRFKYSATASFHEGYGETPLQALAASLR